MSHVHMKRRKLKGQKSVSKGIRFAPDVFPALRAEAKERGFSAVVNDALRRRAGEKAVAAPVRRRKVS